MLELIYARPDSIGDTLVLKTLSDNIKKRKCLYIVPDQFTATAERHIVANLGAAATLSLQVMGLSHLASFIFDNKGGRKIKNLSEGGIRIMLSGVIDSLRGELKYYKSASHRSGFIEELLTQIREFSAYEVGGESLLKASAESIDDADLADKLYDLSILTSGYRAVATQKAGGAEHALDIACDMCEGDNLFEEYDIVLDHFKRFTPQEFRAIEVMLRSKSRVTIALMADPINRGQNELEAFFIPTNTAAKLKKLAEQCGVGSMPDVIAPLKENINRPLFELETKLFDPFKDPLKNTDGIRIVTGDTQYDEIDFVASEIRRLMCKHGYRFRDFSVITRQNSMSSGLIESIFARHDIAVQTDSRTPLSAMPLITLVLSAFDAVRGGYTYDDIFRYLKTGLAGLSSTHVDALENYCYSWKIRGRGWTTPFNMHPEGYNQKPSRKSAAMLRLLNMWRRQVIEPLERFAKGVKKGGAADISVALFNLLSELEIPSKLEEIAAKQSEDKAQIYRQVWDCVIDVIDDMTTLHEDAVTPERYAELFKLATATTKLGIIPATLDCVLISEVERVLPRSVKCAFVTGFTDGNFPLTKGDSGLLSERERRSIEGTGIELAPSALTFEAQERYLVYTALACPTEKLYITIPKSSIGGGAMRSSVYFPHIKHLLKEVDVEHCDDIFEKEGPASSVALVEALLKGGTLDGGAEERAEVERARHKKKAASRALLTTPLSSPQELYSNRSYVSATAGERFAKCKFSYFCKYGLNLAPKKLNEFDSMQTGTFIHYVLEKFFLGTSLEQRSSASKEQLQDMLKKITEDYITEFMPDMEERSERFKHLFWRLSIIVENYLDILLAELKNSKFVPLGFEVSVGDDIPALVYGEGDSKIVVRGKIDRVDGMDVDGKTYIRVVDYKTGIKQLDYSELYQGIGLQMFLYMAALLSGGEAYGKELLPAGVVYAPVRLDVVTLDKRDATEEEISAERMKKISKNGILVDDDNIINAMDESGKFFGLPVSTDKSGNLKKGTSVATLEQLGRLSDFAARLLQEASSEISRGDIDINPIKAQKGKGTDSCLFCDMSAVCRYEGVGREPKYMDNQSFWKAIGEV